MRSKTSIKGHPLHPILVSFPIAFFTGAVILDLLGYLTGKDYWWETASVVIGAGLIGAVVAAVPGMIDYLLLIPPDSSAKKRGTYHLLLNLSATACLACAWLLRNPLPEGPGLPAYALEIIGFGLMAVGGWLGGTLVYRNQIGVDHRYANAGKWQEATIADRPGRIPIGKSDGLGIDQMKLLHLGDRRIVLARTREGWTAFDDRCTHKGGTLADGVLACNTVTCPWHGSQFDIRTGNTLAGPARENLQTYRILEENGELYLISSEAGDSTERIADKVANF